MNRDTRALVACPELLVRKLVELGIEPATLRTTGRNLNHTTNCPPSFLGFDLDLWSLKVIWGRKILYHSEAHCMTSYLTYMDTISLSRTVFEIFDFNSFQGLTLTFDLWRSSEVEIIHAIRKPIYDFLFDFYGYHLSISYRFRDIRLEKFLGFDLDLWPLKVIQGQNSLYHSKAHIWLPIWLLWTLSLYLEPFSKYSTWSFWGLTLTWRSSRVKIFLYYSRAHIWPPIKLL